MKDAPEPKVTPDSSDGVTRIAIIGNEGGGKTTLARKIALKRRLPITHVDSIQYLAGFVARPEDETRHLLNKIANEEKWIIDGYGPFDVLEKRLARAHVIILVNFPVWRHYWWTIKRQFGALFHPRSELPPGCSERSPLHVLGLLRTISRMKQHVLPVLKELLIKNHYSSKVFEVTTVEEWKLIAEAKF